jgi:hypothetical protein
MKKVFSILAVVVMCAGLFSCEAETNLDETQNLFETNACDGCGDSGDERDDPDGGN